MTDTPAAFFATTFVLAAPFYILNALAYLEVLGELGIAPIYIALFTVTPVASVSLLTFRKRGKDGLKQLLWRILDFKRIGDYRWYGAILLLPLLIYGVRLRPDAGVVRVFVRNRSTTQSLPQIVWANFVDTTGAFLSNSRSYGWSYVRKFVDTNICLPKQIQLPVAEPPGFPFSRAGVRFLADTRSSR